jgi:hypothetical protein
MQVLKVLIVFGPLLFCQTWLHAFTGDSSEAKRDSVTVLPFKCDFKADPCFPFAVAAWMSRFQI